ncbi:hypothetical protein [Streptomyces spiralis]|nr:hypothetical protein [Streptomyces spiralis]
MPPSEQARSRHAWPQALATAHPDLDIAARVITLRQDKLLGRLLDRR